MLKRVGPAAPPPSLPRSVFLYYHTLGITLPTATTATAAATAAAATATWNGIAFGGPVLQIRFTRRQHHSRGKKERRQEENKKERKREGAG